MTRSGESGVLAAIIRSKAFISLSKCDVYSGFFLDVLSQTKEVLIYQYIPSSLSVMGFFNYENVFDFVRLFLLHLLR